MIEEKEIKILLSKAEYEKVLVLFAWDKAFIQTNYYYGNIDMVDLGEEDKTIRIRERNGIYFLQVKVPELKRDSLHIKKEYEEKITTVPDQISRMKLEQLTGTSYERDVFLLGKLKTLRKETKISDDILICLDKNEYYDKTDYEIEIEFNQEYPYHIVFMLEKLGIKTNREINGKFSRFFERYKCEKQLD